MPIEITIPRLGWSMEEGVFSGWLKNDGDLVKPGDPLFAVESDKVTMDVESLDAGILHIAADSPESGATVKVGQRIGFLLADGEHGIAATPQLVQTSQPAIQSPLIPALPLPEESTRRPVSPRARALAKTLGIDLSQVEQSGSNRIEEADVRRAFEKRFH